MKRKIVTLGALALVGGAAIHWYAKPSEHTPPSFSPQNTQVHTTHVCDDHTHHALEEKVTSSGQQPLVFEHNGHMHVLEGRDALKGIQKTHQNLYDNANNFKREGEYAAQVAVLETLLLLPDVHPETEQHVFSLLDEAYRNAGNVDDAYGVRQTMDVDKQLRWGLIEPGHVEMYALLDTSYLASHGDREGVDEIIAEYPDMAPQINRKYIKETIKYLESLEEFTPTEILEWSASEYGDLWYGSITVDPYQAMQTADKWFSAHYRLGDTESAIEIAQIVLPTLDLSTKHGQRLYDKLTTKLEQLQDE